MRKLITILLVILILAGIGTGGWFYIKANPQIADTYIANFKDNLFNLRLEYERKKIEKQAVSNEPETIPVNQSVQPEIEQTEEPNETQQVIPVQSPQAIPTQSPRVGEDIVTKVFYPVSNPIALKGAANCKYAKYSDGILCVSESTVDFYTADAKLKWSRAIQISNPVLKVNGNYILIFEQGGKKFTVFEKNTEIIKTETSEIILNGNISANADIAFVTEKPYYKGAVCVYNSSGEEIFSRSFGSENVIAVAISDSRRVAVALMSLRTQIYSKLVFLDVNKSDEDVSVEYDDTLIYDIDFSKNNLIAFADNRMISLSSGGREQWVNDYTEKKLMHYSKDVADIRLLMFDNNNNAEMSVISNSGREKSKIQTDVIPDFSDICDGNIIYNNARNLIFTRLNGDVDAKYTASRDIQKAYFIDKDNILVVYNQSIEFLRLKRKESEE